MSGLAEIFSVVASLAVEAVGAWLQASKTSRILKNFMLEGTKFVSRHEAGVGDTKALRHEGAKAQSLALRHQTFFVFCDTNEFCWGMVLIFVPLCLCVFVP